MGMAGVRGGGWDGGEGRWVIDPEEVEDAAGGRGCGMPAVSSNQDSSSSSAFQPARAISCNEEGEGVAVFVEVVLEDEKARG